LEHFMLAFISLENSFILRGFRFLPCYSGVPDISGVEVLVGHDTSFPDHS